MSPRCSPSSAWSAGRKRPPTPPVSSAMRATANGPGGAEPSAARGWLSSAQLAGWRQRHAPLQFSAAFGDGTDAQLPVQLPGPFLQVGQAAAALGRLDADAIVGDGQDKILARLDADLDLGRAGVPDRVGPGLAQGAEQMLAGLLGDLLVQRPAIRSAGAKPSGMVISATMSRICERRLGSLASPLECSAKIAERICLIVSSSASTALLTRLAASGSVSSAAVPS